MSTGIRSILRLAVLLVAHPLGVLATELDTASVDIVTVPDEILFDGRVEVVETYTVAAQTAGRVVDVWFDVDDFVPEGEAIVRLYVTREQARMTGEPAGDTLVGVPFGLIVIERHIETGDTIKPGTPLMTGVRLDSLRVTTQVPEHLIDTLHRFRTTSVILSDMRDGRVVAEDVTIISLADDSSHGFEVLLKLPELEEPVLPGSPVKVAITAGQVHKLMVPASSIVHRNEMQGVYVIDDGGIHFRQVYTGRRLGQIYREIEAGLSVGERVAIDPVQAASLLKRAPVDTSAPAATDQAIVITLSESTHTRAAPVAKTLPATTESIPAVDPADEPAAIQVTSSRAVPQQTPEHRATKEPENRSEQVAATSGPGSEVRDMTDTWVVNLAAHSSESLARRSLARFRDSGVDAELVRVTVRGRPMIRIRATGYRSRREASDSIPLLEKRLGLEGAWVAKYQPGEE